MSPIEQLFEAASFSVKKLDFRQTCRRLGGLYKYRSLKSRYQEDLIDHIFNSSATGSHSSYIRWVRKDGLEELRDKLAGDHKISGFFNHPLRHHFPEFHSRVWKWDFQPAGEKSSTRKGWRLFAYVEDPNGPEPILATPFLLYAKPGPKGDPAKYVADALRDFLSKVVVKTEEVKFRRQMDDEGRHMSFCIDCWERVAHSEDLLDLDIAEDTHECPGIPAD